MEYTQILGNVTLGQSFVASQQVGEWYEIDFPSEHGPATGWIQAVLESNVGRWKIADPSRGLIGVSVCPTAGACASSPTRLSYLWDQQQIVELEQVLAQNGCTRTWIKTSVLKDGTGWVCGDFLKAETSSEPTGLLNDTGITASQCFAAFGGHLLDYLFDCNSNLARALSSTQDGMVGRDITHNDDSDGHTGFSFTKIGNTGAELSGSASDWSCVKDNVTGLIWEVKTADGGLRDKGKTYTNYSMAYNPVNQYGTAGDATGFVNEVNSQGLCDATDWRLPTADELHSLVDYSVGSFPYIFIDVNYFPNTAGRYWSSSPRVYNSQYAWTVVFNNIPALSESYPRNFKNGVRLVRATQSATTANRYTISSDEQEVTDNQTGLIWRRCAEGMTWDGNNCQGSYSRYTLEQAFQRAEAFAAATGKAWRLPNVKELTSIVDRSRAYPAIDTAVFPLDPRFDYFDYFDYFRFWSSTPAAVFSSTKYGWIVDFREGSTLTFFTVDEFWPVRLVRTSP